MAASHRWFHLALVGLWTAIGLVLRFANLTGKPPWTDEFATLVFSLGHSFQMVPLNQFISLETLLQPLQPSPDWQLGQVIHSLTTEDTHPPLYFVLAHLWLGLWPHAGNLVSLWVARALPALFGAIAIPMTFYLGWVGFQSRLVGHLAAALLAVSPFGIFLSQEARHYSLGAMWVVASLTCLAIAARHLRQSSPVPIAVILTWIGVNALGMATHYFFVLTLVAEGLVLLGVSLRQSPRSNGLLPKRLWLAVMGTLAGILVWLPFWFQIYGGETTQWIYKTDRFSFLSLISPIFQAIAAWLTMVALLPIEAKSLPVVICFVVIMVIFFLWALPIFYYGVRMQLQSPNRLTMQVLLGFVAGAIALFFGITYGLGTDLTRGARYNFVYFPAVTVVVAASLAVAWLGHPAPKPGLPAWSHPRLQGKTAVAIVWMMGLLSSITVAGNLGYQKYYHPDELVPRMQAASPFPIAIATAHRTLVQTGEMMGIAWEWQRSPWVSDRPQPQFLLAQDTCNPQFSEPSCLSVEGSLYQSLPQVPRPFDLWLVNFFSYSPEPTILRQTIAQALQAQHCTADANNQSWVDGYDYQHYRCE